MKQCQTCGNDFVLTKDDTAFLGSMNLPEAKECHLCIWKHLLSFWVFGKFRKTQSALSGKSIITTFSEAAPFPIYSRDEWVSDEWEPLDYGRQYDSSRSFLEQVSDLMKTVPHPHQSGTKNTDCQWSDDVWNCKNCYLSRSMVNCEDSFYLYRVINSRDCIDSVFCFDSEFLYDCVYCFKSSRLQHCVDTRDSIDSAFLYDCRNCQECFMSWNLRNKRYCIENVQYTKEEYEKKRSEYDTASSGGLKNTRELFENHVRNDAIHRATHNLKIENSTGNFLEECKNAKECYYIQYSENTRYVFRGADLKDLMYSVGTIAEKGVMSVVDAYMYDTVATLHSGNCRYSRYLDYCEECEYCFGCVGLRKKKFCILNVQYTEEEYKLLIAQIEQDMKERGEWGSFFPRSLAYGGYNVSAAMMYFPLGKNEVRDWGGRWEDEENSSAEGLRGDQIPETSDSVSDDFSKQPLICERTGRRFNIAPGELQFYRRFAVPIPRLHPDIRVLDRFRPVSAVTPFQATCAYCGKETIAYYPPEWGYKNIACDDCYQQNVN